MRVFADENVSTFNFLIENGVEFIEKPIGPEAASTVPRTFVTVEWQKQDEIYAPRRRPQRFRAGPPPRAERAQEGRADPAAPRDEEHRARAANSGKVLGIAVAHPGGTLNIEARKGVIIATGGHTGNVNFRRTFDPRLTEEYQQACLPYVFQGAKGELAAMDIGASLWATANQTSESAPPSPRRVTSAAAGATARWCSSPRASCSRSPRRPASPSAIGRT